MKFKVGDKVKILDRVGARSAYYPLYFDSMLQYAGTLTSIKKVANSNALLLDNNPYYWDKRAVELVNEDKYLHPSELKDGDFIKIERSIHSYILIFKEYKNNIIYRYIDLDLADKYLYINSFGEWGCFHNSDKITYATEEEKKLLLDELAEKGYAWNSFNNMLTEIPNVDLTRLEFNKDYIDWSVIKLKSSQELNLFPKKKYYQLNFNY